MSYFIAHVGLVTAVSRMNQNAGSGEKVTITSGGNATLTLRRLTAPAE
jgi:hypothetical protein